MSEEWSNLAGKAGRYALADIYLCALRFQKLAALRIRRP